MRLGRIFVDKGNALRPCPGASFTSNPRAALSVPTLLKG
jgi:hypothetical protein